MPDALGLKCLIHSHDGVLLLPNDRTEVKSAGVDGLTEETRVS